jgi:O-phosphoseryl-tRNA(Cys) synthetase
MEKKEIHSILEDYRKGEIGTDDAIYEILRLFSVSKRFNFHSFSAGLAVGAFIIFIVMLTAL